MNLNLYEIVKDYYDSAVYSNVVINLDKSTVTYFCNNEVVIDINFKICTISSSIICELSKIEYKHNCSIHIIYNEKIYDCFFYDEIFLTNSESEEDYIKKIYINTIKLIIDEFFDFIDADINDYDTAKYYYHEICSVFKNNMPNISGSGWEVIGKALLYILDNIKEAKLFKNDINELINFFK